MNNKNKPSFLKWASVAAMALAGFGISSSSEASVLAGCDYFTTDPSSYFFGINFTGVTTTTIPSGCNGSNVPSGSFDTVVQRLNDVTTDTGTTELQMMALNLVSESPVYGGQSLYVTLNSSGPQANNVMTITGANSGGGYFSSTLNFFIDFRVGGINGTIVDSQVCSALGLNCNGSGGSFNIAIATPSPVAWSATATPAGVAACPGTLIGNECHTVKGVTTDGVHFFPAPALHRPIPEIDAASASSAISLLLGILALVNEQRRRKVA